MSDLTRRHLLTTGAAGIAALSYQGSAAATTREAAVAATAFDGNPPIYRARLGAAELTVVSDGTIGFPPSLLLPDVPVDELESFLLANHQSTDRVPLQLNAMVVDLNGRRVVIDAGCGGKFDPTAGRLADHMEAAGLDPDSVDAVVVTHLHPDHLWGATDAENEAPVFANAEIVVPEVELDFWNDPDLAASMPSELFRLAAEGTFAHLQRLGDRLRPVAASREALPGIRFVPTPGHTPGHGAIAIESEGELLLSTGDLVGDPIFSFERPDWRFGFDWDPDQGVASRRAFLDRAAGDRTRVFGFHLPWPGFGHVARSGEAYRWIPEKWFWEP